MQVFDKGSSANTVTIGGKSYVATAESNLNGTTKVFDTTQLPPADLEKQVFGYAMELSGGKAIEPVMQNGIVLPGRWAVKLDDGTTINVRSISSSGVGRWTIDLKGNPALQSVKPNYKDNAYEIKFK